MSFFIIIRGPLGVGKSTISKKLSDQINGKYLSIDEVLAENHLDQGEDGIPVENFIKANEIAMPLIEQSIKNGVPIIIDGNFYYEEAIKDLEEKLHFPHKVFTLKCPVEICIDRDNKREKSYGKDTTEFLHWMVSKFDYGINIDASKETPEEIVNDIKENLGEFNIETKESMIKNIK